MSRRRLFVIFHLSFLLLFAKATAVAQPQLAPLPVKDALKTLNLSMFSPISLSPDGKLVAYTLHDATRKSGSTTSRSPQDLERVGIPRGADYCDIWISDTADGTTRNLTQGKGTSWAPVWSPDGKYLAFYSERGGTAALWLWEKSSGKLRKASDAIVRTRVETSVPRWLPDSKKVVIKVNPEGMTVATMGALLEKPTAPAEPDVVKEPGSTVVLFTNKAGAAKPKPETRKAPLNSNLIAYATDLAVVDVETRMTTRIARRLVFEDYWISPNGTQVSVLIYKGRQSHENLQTLYDLSVVSLSTGQSKTLVSDFGSDILIPVSWSPDSKYLAYLTAGPITRNDCWVVSANGGEPRNVTRGEHPVFEGNSLYRAPLWDAGGNNLFLLARNSVWQASVTTGQATALASIPGRTLRDIVSHDGRTVWSPNDDDTFVVLTNDEENRRQGFYKIKVNTGSYEKLLEENKSYGFVPPLRTAISSDQRRLVYTSQSTTETEDIWTIENDQFRPRRVTHTNAVFDRYVMGDSRMIEWQTLNGQKVRGALLLPAGYIPGKRYPLIVYQYPGSNSSRNVNLFGFNPFSSAAENWQLFATRGYAVLMPDVPAKPETYMRDIAAAVVPAVDKVIELGICDPERVGVTGQSNGGYGVLSLIVQTNRFRAAVDRMGPGNLISQYTQMNDTGVSLYTGEMVIRTGGSLWEKRSSFIENSPIFYFDRVQTPLLIVQGTADRQTMVARSDEVFVSLRFLGKEVEYARYAGEPHGVADWSFANQVDSVNRVIAWFDRWLKN